MTRSHLTGNAGRLTLLGVFLYLLLWTLPVLPGLPFADARTNAPQAAKGWSVGRHYGVDWLVAPEGELFYSAGVNIVSGHRKTPKAENGTAFWWGNHYQSIESWRAEAERQLDAWGFNTRGGWSDVSQDFRLPHIVEMDLGRRARLHWFDPFSPDAVRRVNAMAEEICAPYRNDPHLIGYFTDNEVGWWNAPLFLWYLKNPWSNHGKRAVMNLLRTHYKGSWDALTRDFVPPTEITGWDGLRTENASLRLRPGGQGIAVVNRFTYIAARRYYTLVRDAVRRAHPGALVMGDRLPLYYNQDAVLAMRGLTDVLSTNYNADTQDGYIAPWYFEGLQRLSDGIPVLISEYFFAADENRSGNLNNGHLMHVATQAERNIGAVNATRNFAAIPNVVGAHWFQMYDEPTGGREDGEDFNFGLIDIHNRPYADLVAGFAALNPNLNDVHAAGRDLYKATDRARRVEASGKPWPIPRAAALTLADGRLTDWDKPATRLPGFHVAAPYVPFGDVHLAWTPEGLYLAVMAKNYLAKNFLAYEGDFPLAETFQVHFTSRIPNSILDLGVYLRPQPSRKYPDVLEVTPLLYSCINGQPTTSIPVENRVSQLDHPLPHIALEAFIPVADLGRSALASGDVLEINIYARTYYREHLMSWVKPTPDKQPWQVTRKIILE